MGVAASSSSSSQQASFAHSAGRSGPLARSAGRLSLVPRPEPSGRGGVVSYSPTARGWMLTGTQSSRRHVPRREHVPRHLERRRLLVAARERAEAAPREVAVGPDPKVVKTLDRAARRVYESLTRVERQIAVLQALHGDLLQIHTLFEAEKAKAPPPSRLPSVSASTPIVTPKTMAVGGSHPPISAKKVGLHEVPGASEKGPRSACGK